ncbi:serine/threonine-protein kinase [Glaciihabitans sp. dw_435]|uniref:serine/threonine-protein kinase n=1 Tax=Glaciihabitans sp. dw_435 TaxID=2720081 RepID=UPI001BD67F44|nr:serine/threonine-protein kinase [Glaciihabitans sp. dw_435]
MDRSVDWAKGWTLVRRLPSVPPVLPGFSHVHVLGSGGFADVFLFEQNMPRRQVAVKVMLSEVVNDQVRQMFQAEANLMAQLSAHPSILTVYQASVSSDGRPYLVMELCSSSLSTRYRKERIPVAEVLRIAVKIGSAVETAHRAGVLHRDIKPSNILLTAYGHPVLSDFGIAATRSEMEGQESVGMSIPWSAPEVLLDETPGSVASEVWSLSATVYSLLAGRSPFEAPGGSNSSTDVINRITKAKPLPIGRPDVPASLERVLAAGMARKPENRPGSVLELIHEFQAIESELGVAQTAIEVAMDDWALATVADFEDRTAVRGVASSLARPGARRRRRSALANSIPSASSVAVLESNPSVRSASATTEPKKSMQTLAWVLLASAIVVIALGVTATFILVRAGNTSIPVVADVQASVSARSVEFTWQDPGIAATDTFQITADGQVSNQRSTSFVVDATAGDRVCVTVSVNRDGKTGSASGEKCVDVGE